MSHPSISLCMIAKNEEDVIAQAIESVQLIVSEVILVDTGSSDRTCEIARSLGAKVITRKWDDDFSAPRNLSLQYASGDWILVLDADEAIAKKDLESLRRLTLDSSCAYELTQRHYSNDQRLSDFSPNRGAYPEWERSYGGHFESSLVRLFPNRAGICYEGRVHELVEHSIRRLNKHRILKSGILIHHYGHTPEAKAKKNKGKLYTPLGKAKITDNPTNWQSFFELGVEHNNNGQLEESVAAFLRSAEMNPGYVSTWVNLGYVLCELKKYKDSIASLQKAISLDPNNSEAFCNIGVVYLRMGQFPHAEKYFQIAINLAPDYVNAFCNLAKTLVYQKRISEAVNWYYRALDIMPQCLTAKLDLASIYLAYKKFDLAEKFLLESAKSDPKNPLVYFHLGEVYKSTGKTKEAVEALTRFCNINQNNLNKGIELDSFIEAAKIDCELMKKSTLLQA